MDWPKPLRKLSANGFPPLGRREVAARPEAPATPAAPLTMREVSQRLAQVRLLNAARAESVAAAPTSDGPVYYSPPSSHLSGVQSFLPPTAQPAPSGRRDAYALWQTPAAAAVAAPAATTDDALDPLGEWLNPVAREALGRQVNKEEQFYALAYYVALALALRAVTSLGRYLKQLYDARVLAAYRYQPLGGALSGYGEVLLNVCFALILAHALVALYQLVKPQDQCLDLVLTNRQRRMLGLKAVPSDDDEWPLPRPPPQSKPLYPRATPYRPARAAAALTRAATPTPSAELTYAQPVQRLANRHFDAKEIDLLSRDFKTRYSLEFDFSDDE
jgi:hypothetical protein